MNKRLRIVGLKGLILGSLFPLIGCNPVETRLERSEILGKVPVTIGTKYTPQYSALEPTIGFNSEGDIVVKLEMVDHPEEYKTIIKSDSLSQEMLELEIYNYFSKQRPDSLEYADFSENTYETDLETHQRRKVYSRDLGRQFVLPFAEKN